MGRKQTNFKLPDSIVEALQAKAAEEETTATDIVIRALKSVLGLSTEKFGTDRAPAGELEKTVADHTRQLSALTHELLALRQKLEQIETDSNSTSKRVKSLKPTQPSTKSHNVIYGRGEAVSIYPGWEVSANISYVLDRFQVLNTDEARAAFADKWIGLCAQSLDTAWVVCYRLLNIIKEKEMYKTALWMEGNKTYNSFKDYFEHRFKKPFKTWLELERTHRFFAETSPELLEALISTAQYGSCKAVLSREAQPELPQFRSTQETDPTSPETTSHIEKDQGESTSVVQKVELQDKAQGTELSQDVRIMTRSEVSKFSGLTVDLLDGRRKRGRLPIEVSVGGVTYIIDCIGAEKKGQIRWSVKPLLQKESSPENALDSAQPEIQPTANTVQLETKPGADTVPPEIQPSTNGLPAELLNQTQLSERLNIPRSTFRKKKAQMSEVEFAEWTSSKDPDRIAWVYSGESKKYLPRI